MTLISLLLGLNTAEVLDPRINEWRAITPMATRRSSVGVAVLGGKNKESVLLLSLAG